MKQIAFLLFLVPVFFVGCFSFSSKATCDDLKTTHRIILCEDEIMPERADLLSLASNPVPPPLNPVVLFDLPKETAAEWGTLLAEAGQKSFLDVSPDDLEPFAILVFLDKHGTPLAVARFLCVNSLITITPCKREGGVYKESPPSRLVRSERLVRAVYDYLQVHHPERIQRTQNWLPVPLETMLFDPDAAVITQPI